MDTESVAAVVYTLATTLGRDHRAERSWRYILEHVADVPFDAPEYGIW